jgi:hypothetical protein
VVKLLLLLLLLCPPLSSAACAAAMRSTGRSPLVSAVLTRAAAFCTAPAVLAAPRFARAPPAPLRRVRPRACLTVCGSGGSAGPAAAGSPLSLSRRAGHSWRGFATNPFAPPTAQFTDADGNADGRISRDGASACARGPCGALPIQWWPADELRKPMRRPACAHTRPCPRLAPPRAVCAADPEWEAWSDREARKSGEQKVLQFQLPMRVEAADELMSDGGMMVVMNGMHYAVNLVPGAWRGVAWRGVAGGWGWGLGAGDEGGPARGAQCALSLILLLRGGCCSCGSGKDGGSAGETPEPAGGASGGVCPTGGPQA